MKKRDNFPSLLLSSVERKTNSAKKRPFRLVADFKPTGDQPQAIEKLERSFLEGKKDQVLLGVTGSGKTFTVANLIQKLQKPTIVLAPNKTLAAQLYAEMKSFFPHNAVGYFVSYYDYYQPEAYIPRTDTFIEKDASINDHIDRMRHEATRFLLEREDVIIVASVSCIYGLGDVEAYSGMKFQLEVGCRITMEEVSKALTNLQYKRNDISFMRGAFRRKGDVLDIFPSHFDDRSWRLSFFGDEIEDIYEMDPLTGERFSSLDSVTIYPNSHYVAPKPTLHQAVKQIKIDLNDRLKEFDEQGKFLEASRLKQRTTFDLEMISSTGMCAGIENYSRYLTGRNPGEPPPTLLEYLPKDALMVVDESHVAVPQLGAMYKGDASRKINLSEYGFRLPACKDNRPLKFEEWEGIRPKTLFVSATPAKWELEKTKGEVVEQIIRPTGLLDPKCTVKPTENQIDDIIHEAKIRASKNQRVLVTTLTKKMSEALTDYLAEAGLKVRYLHSDVDTLERSQIIQDLRKGVFDVLVGINLLREGLDIPECSLVAILDADKQGFLRSKTALVQTIGRAARNVDGEVFLYADKMVPPLEEALKETERRRSLQNIYNKKNNIKPSSVKKSLKPIMAGILEEKEVSLRDESGEEYLSPKDLLRQIQSLEKKMLDAAENLEFEKASCCRDEIKLLEKKLLQFS
mgnify:CR=1 FL=1